MPSPALNRRIVLARRPEAAATLDCFRLEEAPIPALRDGQIGLRTLWLSLDPYMRGRMSDAPSYAAPVAVGEVMTGGTVCRIEVSRHPAYAAGELVQAMSGWQEYAVSDGEGLRKLPPAMTHPSQALGILGMPGFTAYMGLSDIGKPQHGETLVVAAATGAVGSVVGQIGKLEGCRVVGIAGGAEKCRWGLEELKFDSCIDHHAPDFERQLAAACPNGVDVYFENVGGAVFRAVLPLINAHGRIPVCGLIAHYQGGGIGEGPDRLPPLMRAVLTKRITMRGFIIFDYADRFNEFHAQMSEWLAAGRIRYREDVVTGLENAPAAFLGMLEGRNFGKLVVKLGTPDSR